MKTTWTYVLLLLITLQGGLTGCSGTQSFGTIARGGDTVALPVGWKQNLQRKNVTVTITDSLGAKTIFSPNDARVRGVVNLYPDPASRAVISDKTGQDFGNNDGSTGLLINSFVTNNDRDWWQSVVVLDLPSNLGIGDATISIADSVGPAIKPIKVNIVPGTGSSNLFNIYNFVGNPYDFLSSTLGYPGALKSMERADVSTVTIGSYQDVDGNDVVPHTIQIEFTHSYGVGVPWIINPRGDIKNVIWNDDGTKLIVLVTPTNGKKLKSLVDLKFYIASGLAGLTQTKFKAYDPQGVLMSGITATVTSQ